ncbi:MAG: hypothetical protein IKF41_01240 [Alphaproteobacteria bacterium]|nr:hypothetical protein [Alphaproteobacteria bacterium]
MKKILLCFMMLFPFVITDAHSSSCPAGYYWDNNGCTLCPNFVDSNFFDDNLYEFHKAEDSDDIESCALKLKLGGENGSKCGADTEVIYSYNKTQQKYILAKADVKPNCTLNYETDKCFLRRLEDDQVFGNRDFCGECAVWDGAYYEDAEHRCRACPNLNGNIGLDGDDYDVDNKLYNFIPLSRRDTLDDFVNVTGMPDDIEAYNYNAVTFGQTGAADEENSELAKYPVSCEVEFNYYAISSSCPNERDYANDGSGGFTSVWYVYDFNQGKYVLAPNYNPYIYLPNNSCNDSAQSCLLAKPLPEELNEDNVNEDLCAECDFKGNYKAYHCPFGLRCSDINGRYQYCAACPMTFNTNLYEFVYGDDNRTCTIKLKVGGENGSKCGAGTNVVYTYDFSVRKYVRDANVQVNVDAGYYGDENSGPYADYCKACPEPSGGFNSDLYEFYHYGDTDGIESCALKLKVGGAKGSKCGAGTNVVYRYSGRKGYELADETSVQTVCQPQSRTDTCFLRKPDDTVDFQNDFCTECDVGAGTHYADDDKRCMKCPDLSTKHTEGDIFYEFLTYPSNTSKGSGCIAKLDVNKSKCNNESNVQYVYNFGTKEYELSGTARTVIANQCTGADNCFLPVTSIPTVLDIREDLCVACGIGQGAYIGNDQCKSCPDFNWQCDGNNCGNLYVYTLIDGIFSELDSCALKLNVGEGGGSKCGADTNVFYKYDTTQGKYIRQTQYKVTKGSTDVLSLDQQPKNFELKDYCKANCSGGYYMNGNVCEQCPAGYKCPAYTNDISACESDTSSNCMKACPVNSYSEKGALECKQCPERSGATTVGSKYCDVDGTACRDWRACSATRMPVLCLNSDCDDNNIIDFGDETYKDIIEILSINKSVYQKKKQ